MHVQQARWGAHWFPQSSTVKSWWIFLLLAPNNTWAQGTRVVQLGLQHLWHPPALLKLLSSTEALCSHNPLREGAEAPQLCHYYSILSPPAQLSAGFPGPQELAMQLCLQQLQGGLTLPRLTPAVPYCPYSTSALQEVMDHTHPFRWFLQLYRSSFAQRIWCSCKCEEETALPDLFSVTQSLWDTLGNGEEDFSSALTRWDSYCLPFPSSDFVPHLHFLGYLSTSPSCLT